MSYDKNSFFLPVIAVYGPNDFKYFLFCKSTVVSEINKLHAVFVHDLHIILY